MPPRRYENRTPEPEHGYRPSFNEEEYKEEELKEKLLQQKPRLEEKKSEQNKKEVPNEEKKTKKKELSPEEKQERRSEAVERSQALKKQFEETPLPNDPSTVARLIIAEQILSINEQLKDPETLNGARKKKELEATLDYMCDLAEKLEDPTIESPPHIQDAYEALLELTEEALQVHAPEEILEEITETLQPSRNESVPPTSEITSLSDPADTELPQTPTHPSHTVAPTIKNLLTYLHLASQPLTNPHPNFQPKPIPITSAPSIPLTASAAGKEFATPLARRTNNHTPESFLARPKVHDAHEYHLAMQPNIAKPLAAVALASIAASAIHRAPDISHRHESTPSPHTTPNHRPAPSLYKEEHSYSANPQAILEKPASHTPAFSSPESFTSSSSEPAMHEHPSYTQSPDTSSQSGKLEHLPLTSLLSLAQDIHVGHGRYLKDEFEHGRIDKDGLIKVLKAKKKGLDFSREFSQQAANFRQRLASIEFITKPPKPTHSDNKQNEPVAHIPTIEQLEPTAEKEEFTHPILERYAHPEKSFFQPSHKSPLSVNLIITILCIIIFTALIIFLLLPA